MSAYEEISEGVQHLEIVSSRSRELESKEYGCCHVEHSFLTQFVVEKRNADFRDRH